MSRPVSRVFIEGCEVVVTMDDAGTEFAGGSILIEDGVITWVGSGTAPGSGAAERINGRGTVAIPGLIHCHTHLYQTLTRVRAMDQGLFGWLKALYPVWAGLDEEWVWAAARVGLAELALTGCTTTTDHHYIFPQTGALLEVEIEAARQIGLRFHPCRGSMDLGASQGGLPPDSIVQDTDTILSQTEEAVRRFHDPSPGSMLRIAVAPCSPFSVTQRLMVESAALARRLGVHLHTHLAETLDEEAYCMQTYGRRPVQLLDDLNWLGPDVWLAHCVHINDREVGRLAETHTGVAWCPTSNLRLGSGFAPGRALTQQGARVGLGLDGGSNDSGHMLAEVRQAMLATRGREGAGAMSAREALRVATRGGARCLGWEQIGSLEVGKRADIALFSVEGLAFAGAQADLVAALVFCSPQRVKHLLAEGRPVVRDGRLTSADEEEITAQGRRVAKQILQRG